MNSSTGYAASVVDVGLDGAAEAVSLSLLESFLRQLSHDVRNDLNAMELLISCVEDEGAEVDVRNALTQLHEAVRYGARRMLRVSRAVQLPDKDCVAYPVDLLAEDLRDRLKVERPELAARIEWIFPGQRTVIQVDATLVLEALTELLDNAASFATGAHKVVTRVEPGEGNIRWSIEQHATEEPLNVQQWGRRPLMTSRRGHYGLGLFRVRRILQVHGAVLSYRFDGNISKLVTEVVFPGAIV